MKSYNGVLNPECIFFGLNSLSFERYRNDGLRGASGGPPYWPI